MNRNAYVLRNAGVTISTAIAILQLKAGTNYPLELLRASLSQFGSTTSAGARFSLVRKSAASTVTAASAGTHLNKLNASNPTSDVSLGTSATGYTGTSAGTNTDILVDEGFNVLNGYIWLPTPEERIIVPQGGIIAMEFLTAPASHTWYASIYFRELG